MAKVTGPMLSLDASGTIAKVLTASRWRGVPYMRQRVIPHNPQTDDQVAIRSLVSDASKAWRNEDSPIDTDYKEAYKEAAAGQPYSGFNLYMRDAISKNEGSNYEAPLDIPTEPGDDEPTA